MFSHDHKVRYEVSFYSVMSIKEGMIFPYVQSCPESEV